MSIRPSSATSLGASANINGSPDPKKFHVFFDCWLSEQNQHLQDLISASKHHQNNNNNNDYAESTRDADERVLRPLINRVIDHYEQYYRAKSRCAKQDVLAMFSPSWRSSLEDAFLWIGGWRPAMAFHLLYSKSGLQLEDRLSELIQGFSTFDLGDISASQLTRVDELQRGTIREEKEISEKMAKRQVTVADSSMVELSHMVTKLMSNEDQATRDTVDQLEEERVESILESKEEGLEEILNKADDLRLRTLKSVIDILTPIQAVHFLIAAAELHLRLHDWGKKRDARHHYHGADGIN